MGDRVGVAVGLLVGTAVGLLVGLEVDALLGSAVGSSEGGTVGCFVGAEVRLVVIPGKGLGAYLVGLGGCLVGFRMRDTNARLGVFHCKCSGWFGSCRSRLVPDACKYLKSILSTLSTDLKGEYPGSKKMIRTICNVRFKHEECSDCNLEQSRLSMTFNVPCLRQSFHLYLKGNVEAYTQGQNALREFLKRFDLF